MLLSTLSYTYSLLGWLLKNNVYWGHWLSFKFCYICGMGASWRVKALAAITEDVPAVHNYLQLRFQGDSCPSFDLCRHHTGMYCAYMHTDKTFIYLSKIQTRLNSSLLLRFLMCVDTCMLAHFAFE